MAPNRRSDAEVRAEDAQRVGIEDDGAAIETRAVGAPGIPVRNRRAQPDADAKRAESRGIYTDPGGARRVVGAGQVIPDGWTRVESATVEDRGGDVTRAAHAAGELVNPAAGASAPSSRSRSSSKSSGSGGNS
jgi:hypothetical protein